MNKICCIFNLAPHYRAAIYRLMDKELKCEFYFIEQKTSIRLMNYNDLHGYKEKLKYHHMYHKTYWHSNTIRLSFYSYTDYIITGDPYCLSTWIILIIAKMLNKKIYLWSHGWYGRESFIKKYIKRIYFSLAYVTLLYGEYAKELMINEGIRHEKLICLYNSLDYECQVKIRDKITLTDIYIKHFNNEYPVILYMGRIQKTKKIDLLIEAIENINKRGIDTNLVIIGKPEIEVDIKILTAKLGESVWIYGACYDEAELAPLIYNSQLCVSPGNVGLTALHCLVYGTPVITHSNCQNQGPEFEAIIEGKTGGFFVENSVEDLSNKIEEWLNKNENQRSRIRKECYSIIQSKYNPQKQIKTLTHVLKKNN